MCVSLSLILFIVDQQMFSITRAVGVKEREKKTHTSAE